MATSVTPCSISQSRICSSALVVVAKVRTSVWRWLARAPGVRTHALTSPGRPGALLRPAPLRTGLARCRASGSSKPKRLAGRAEVLGRCHGVLTAAAFCVYETEAAGLARPVALPEDQALLAQRLPGNANPLLPLGRGLRRVIGVQGQGLAAWRAPGPRLSQTPA